MAAAKTERLLQLVLCLTQTQHYVTKARLRTAIPDYADCPTDDAFERMFERDKHELRELGVPVETGSADVWHDDDPGYRIDRRAYVLPDLALTREEMTAVAVAARVWAGGGAATAAARAMAKLQASGLEVDADALPSVAPRLSGGEAAFGPLADAVSARRAVTFDYRGSGAGAPSTRHLQPWGVVSRRGHWYVVGHDTDRDAVRVFRLSRIDGPVHPAGRAEAFEVPPDVDLGAHVETFDVQGAEETAVLRVEGGAGWGLRRRALPEQDDGLVRLRYHDGEALAAEITSYGASVRVEEPASLRDAVVRRLRGVLAAAVAGEEEEG